MVDFTHDERDEAIEERPREIQPGPMIYAPIAPMVPQQEMSPLAMFHSLVERGIDVTKIGDKLLDLADRWEKSQARKAFDAAIAAAKSEIKPIVKNKTVSFGSSRAGAASTAYMHEDMAQIARQVDPILSKHGLHYRYRSEQEGSSLKITCILSHRDGHYEECSLAAKNDDTGNKNTIQGIGSTATYLQRYTLKLALGLSAAKDDDGQSSEAKATLTERQQADLLAKLDEVAGDRAKFLQWAQVDSVADILQVNYKAVLAEIERKGRVDAEQRAKVRK